MLRGSLFAEAFVATKTAIFEKLLGQYATFFVGTDQGNAKPFFSHSIQLAFCA